MSKLVIGCLHGCCQKSSSFQSILKTLMKKISRKCGLEEPEFYFLEGKTWYRTEIDLSFIGIAGISLSQGNDSDHFLEENGFEIKFENVSDCMTQVSDFVKEKILV